MKRLFLKSLLSLPFVAGFSIMASAQAASETKLAPLPNTLLWQISGNGLKQPSYLFGTMHILCADDAKLTPALKNVIDQSQEVYFEIDLDDMAGMMQSLKFMRMGENRKLSDLLNANDYAKVKGYFEKHPFMLPFSILESFKPLVISSLVEEDGLDCKTTNGMEMVIMKESHEHKRKINGLETAEFQAGLFDSIPYQKQAEDLVNYIDSVDSYRKATNELAQVYKQQNLERIDELTRTGDAGISNYLDLLLYGRNRKWVRELDSLLPSKSLLIAVGAGHLPGEQGLINLLRLKGYTVSPIMN